MNSSNDKLPPKVNQAVIAGLVTSQVDKMDTVSKIGLKRTKRLRDITPDQLYDYIRPFYESIVFHDNVHGVIVYDELPSQLLERCAHDRFHFCKGPLTRAHRKVSAADQRFAMIHEFLLENESIEALWITDVNDVTVARDPFAWMNEASPFRDLFFSGEEGTVYSENEIWDQWMLPMDPEDRDPFYNEMRECRLLTVGTWGGRRPVVMEFYRRFLEELERLFKRYHRKMPAGMDMLAFNFVVRREFMDRCVTFRLHTNADHPERDEGLSFRGTRNPFLHDRDEALDLLETMRERRRLGLEDHRW